MGVFDGVSLPGQRADLANVAIVGELKGLGKRDGATSGLYALSERVNKARVEGVRSGHETWWTRPGRCVGRSECRAGAVGWAINQSVGRRRPYRPLGLGLPPPPTHPPKNKERAVAASNLRSDHTSGFMCLQYVSPLGARCGTPSVARLAMIPGTMTHCHPAYCPIFACGPARACYPACHSMCNPAHGPS